MAAIKVVQSTPGNATANPAQGGVTGSRTEDAVKHAAPAHNTSSELVSTESPGRKDVSEAHRKAVRATKGHVLTGAHGPHGEGVLSRVDREDKSDQERVLVVLLVKADVLDHLPLLKDARNQHALLLRLPPAGVKLIESTPRLARDTRLKTTAAFTSSGCQITVRKHAVLHHAPLNPTKTATVQSTTTAHQTTAISNNS